VQSIPSSCFWSGIASVVAGAGAGTAGAWIDVRRQNRKEEGGEKRQISGGKERVREKRDEQRERDRESGSVPALFELRGTGAGGAGTAEEGAAYILTIYSVISLLISLLIPLASSRSHLTLQI
jgi:hypothetical protein